jgi:cytochrome c55X
MKGVRQLKQQKRPDAIPARPMWPVSTSLLIFSTIVCAGALNLLPLNMALAASATAPQAEVASPSPARRGELITLVRQDCGSCHGLTLKGGLGPALLPDVLRDKPADSLQATIVYGRPGTAMPPWKRFLSEAEAAWIVEQLQKGFPDEK